MDQAEQTLHLRSAEADSLAAAAMPVQEWTEVPGCWSRLAGVRMFHATQVGDSATSDSILALLDERHRANNDLAALCRAYTMIGEGWYRRADGRRATMYLDSSVAIARRNDDPLVLAGALGSRSGVALDYETPEAAIELQREALGLVGTPPRDTALAVRLLGNLGMANVWIGALDSASMFHQRALELLRSKPDERMVAWNQMNLGTVLLDQGNYLAAIDLLEQALRYHERENALFDQGTCLFYLAQCQEHVLPPDHVVDTYEKVIAIYDTLDMSLRSMVVQTTLGRYLIDLDSTHCAQAGLTFEQRNDLAERVCAEALRVGRGSNSPMQLVEVLDAMTDVERAMGRNDSALAHAREAVRLREVIGDPSRLAAAYKDLGAALRNMGRKAEAQEAFDTATGLFATAPQLEGQASLHEELQEFHAEQGHYREAYEHVLEVRRIQDGLMDEEKRQEVVRSQLRYDFGRRQLADSLANAAKLQQVEDARTIAELRAEQATRRSWAMGLGGSLLLLGAGGGFYLDRKRRRERFARQTAELETRAMRAQMDPHFIGNTLHAVNGYLLGHDPQAASALLSRFSKWIRSTLESSRRETVTLGEDIEAMRTYLALEQARTNDRFTYRIDVPEDEELLRLHIPPMLVQPILENAIVHGILPVEGKGHIDLKVADKDDHLLISVVDNGVGRKASSGAKEEARKKSSLSARITEERLDLLGARSGKIAGMRVVDLPQGTRVELRLPLQG